MVTYSGTLNTVVNDKAVVRACPFCRKKNVSRKYINTICPCGAKYYFVQKKWLNRKTGEWRTSHAIR